MSPTGRMAHAGHVGGRSQLACPLRPALAATWDPQLVRLIGEVLGEEALDKGARVILAPTVNIHRTLSGAAVSSAFPRTRCSAAPWQSPMCRACRVRVLPAPSSILSVTIKSSTGCRSISKSTSDRCARSTCPPSRQPSEEANVSMVMSAYNKLRGEFCSESRGLLVSVLKEEWGFEGVVVSDWFGTHSTSALGAGLDLEMPGPASFLGAPGRRGCPRGRGCRCGACCRRSDAVAPATAGCAHPTGSHRPQGTGGARAPSRCGGHRPAEERVLAAPARPWMQSTSLAVFGPAAARLCPQGAGAAEVTPPYVRSPLPAILDRAGTMTVTYEPGCVIPGPVPPLGPFGLRTPNGYEGIAVEYFASDEPDATQFIATSSRCRGWCGSVRRIPASARADSAPEPRPSSLRTGRAPGTSV